MTNSKGRITVVKAAGLYIYIFYIHIREDTEVPVDEEELPPSCAPCERRGPRHSREQCLRGQEHGGDKLQSH